MRSRNWKLVVVGLSVMLVAAGFASEAAPQEKKISIQPSEVPAVIKQAIEKAFAKGQIIAIQQEAEGENPGQYDVDIRSDGKEYEVEISPEGKVIEIKEKAAEGAAQAGKQEKKWTDSFGQESCTFSSVGGNRFFILEPGHQLVLESRTAKVVITVLDETKKIGSIETRVVEEREEEDGELKEVSRNFFAVCKEHGDVFYFGEDVDDYENGKIVKHPGAWRADRKDSRAGIIMPGTVLLGARHYQEIAPNAMDRAEIISDDVTMKTPAGTFKNCIRVEETSGLDPNDKCYKTYAPGVGLIQDEDLLLSGHGEAKEVSVALEDLPRAVRAAIKNHAASGEVTEIEKKSVDGKIVYEAEVVLNGKASDILISAKGKYLGTEKEEANPEQGREDKGEGQKDK
jgi:uncharacterized membrane protein YkoI